MSCTFGIKIKGMKRRKKDPYSSWARKIIHIDMDAFYAAIEQRDRPELRGKPVVVGGNPYGRGVVSTASYEARKYGIHSAMPAYQAKKLCPQAIFVRPHFEKYHAVSNEIMSIFEQHTDFVEAASLDEAYLDVTQHKLGLTDPKMIASLIKQNIRAVTRVTASAGVSTNLFLAKVASDFQKPDGLTVVGPTEIADFLKDLPIRKIPGVGPVAEKELHKLDIRTCGQLAGASRLKLMQCFGKWGAVLHERSRGIDHRRVEPEGVARQNSTEETFVRDITDLRMMKAKLMEYAGEVFNHVKKDGFAGRTAVLKVKYHDFTQITRSHTFKADIRSADQLYEEACHLLTTRTLAGKKPIRLLGIGISGLGERSKIPDDLFTLTEK